MRNTPAKLKFAFNEPAIRVIRAFEPYPDLESTFRRTSFPVVEVERVSELGSASSVIHLRSGVIIPVAMPYAELDNKVYGAQENTAPLNLFDVTGEATFHLPECLTPGQKIKDGSIYIGHHLGRDWYTTPRDAEDFQHFDGAIVYARKLRAHGHTDWQVPPVSVLSRIYQLKNKPSLSGTFCTSTKDNRNWYRSSTVVKDPNTVSDIDFNDGDIKTAAAGCKISLRCVRGVPRKRPS